MKILAVFRDAPQLARIAAQLREGGHEVAIAGDRATACTKVLQSVPDTAIIDPLLPLAEGIALVKTLRAIHSAYVYVLAAARNLDEEQLRSVYEAGADGELRSLDGRDLRLRLGAVQRLLGARASGPSEKSAGSPAQAPPPATQGEIDLHMLAGGIGDAIATLATVPATLAAPEQSPELAHVVGIKLTNVEREQTLFVTVGVARDAANALTTHMFGEASEELARDMVGELANISMGTCKAMLAKLACPFTGGLPEALTPAGFVEFGASGRRTDAATIVLQGFHVHLRLSLASSQNLTVTVDKLREGMVLVNDVFNARGVLVLAAKTRLSETSVNRLQAMLPQRSSIEVATGGA